jgi:uncharacterized 2Fe-2S/4Fe-4S cluster protein (DUF4445 family)
MSLVVEFRPAGVVVGASDGESLLDVAAAAGVQIDAPCGGQGRCGRCKVRVQQAAGGGLLRSRDNARLAPAELSQGYRLSCQTFMDGHRGSDDEEHRVVVVVPRAQKKQLRQLGHANVRPDVVLDGVDWREQPPIRSLDVRVEPPSLADNTSDLDRLRRELASLGHQEIRMPLPLAQRLGHFLRDADWSVALTLDLSERDSGRALSPKVIAIGPASPKRGRYGLAVDVGTTSVVVYLVQLDSGRVIDSAAEYNAQISCGDDVISRIVYSQRGQGLRRLQQLAIQTINGLVEELVSRAGIQAEDICRVVAAGNTVMTHLLLGVDPRFLREDPYTPTFAVMPMVLAAELGLAINPYARVDLLPSVGSWVGGDITAGVLSSGLYRTEKLTLFLDIGTNGEVVLGNKDWLLSCACSAGPAFEGGGVGHGMRAASGAIEDVWIDAATLEPTFRTVEDAPARGLCGTGLIDLLAELFLTGALEKSGRFTRERNTPRLREGAHGMEYVVAWQPETELDHDIVLTETDVESLIRAKAAIYAGCSVLCRSVGVSLADVEEVLVGGAFGQYIDVPKAVQIGLLPDLPVGRFHFLGNTSALGAYLALLSLEMREEAHAVAGKMTYLELSADNTFMDEFMSALFLPHTDIDAFPSVEALLREARSSVVAPVAPTFQPVTRGQGT